MAARVRMGRMRWSWPGALAPALLLLVAPVHAAPWLQYGMTADGSSYTTDPGPLTDDIAWTSNLGGSRAIFATPLVIGEWVYVLESSGPLSREGSKDRLHRISLATGESTVFTTLSQAGFQLASDGEHLIISGAESILLLRIEDGTPVRELAYPDDVVPNPYRTFCLLMAVDGPRLYAFCVALGNQMEASRQAEAAFGYPFRDVVRAADGATVGVAFVSAYELTTGERLWEWFADASAHAPSESPFDGTAAQAAGLSGMFPLPIPTGLAVIGNHVVATGGVAEGVDPETRSHAQGHCYLALLNKVSGKLDHRFSSRDAEYESGSQTEPLSCVLAGEPRGDENRIFGKFQRAFSINPQNNAYLNRGQPLEGGEHETGSGAAYDGTSAYIGSWKKITKFNSELAPQASFSIPVDMSDALLDFSPILTPTTLYAMTHEETNGAWHTRGALYALKTDGDGLTLKWRMELPHDADSVYGFNYIHAVGEGLLVMAGMDGNVIAVGNAAASPKPVVNPSTFYPALDESFTIDLSGSQAGSRGSAPDSFRAEWGDGSVTDWQPDPVLQHTYVSAPAGSDAYTVRAQARNADGHSASEFVTIYAGGSPAETETDVPFAGIFSALALLVVAVLVVLLLLTRRRLAAVYAMLEGRAAQRFEVVRELGRGTYGVAQLARDTKLERLVVLKQPYAPGRMSATQREAFLEEAKLAARVQHPNVVSVFEALPDQDPPVLVLEYAPGGSLEDVLESGRIDAARARTLTIDMLQGLAAVHAAGILHRDLKPSNVLLDADGRAKITDFGIAASAVQPNADETMAFGGTALGTVAYMSPEQLTGSEATEASDLYAAAAISYRMFTGRHHADGRDGSVEAVRRRILDSKPNVNDKAIPRAVQPILQRALAHKPGQRFPDVPTFLAAFETASRAAGGTT